MIAAMSAPLPPQPDLDPASVFPEIAQWRAAVAAADWPAVRAVFDALTEPDDRSFAVRQLGEIDGSEDFFAKVAADDGSGTLAQVLSASRHVEMGWEARTAARARKVSREQFAVFHDHLRSAERLLIDVTAREPDNAAAWDLRIIVARGLELGQSEARRRYRQLAKQHPHHFPAQTQLLQQLCPKWGGSWDAVHQFARECALDAPEGRHNAVLVAEGHLERWIDLPSAEREPYLRQPALRQEIRDAAERSVLHPASRRDYRWLVVQNTFAMASSLAGEYDDAAVHFRALDNHATRFPWGYLGDPATGFARHRATALGEG